MKNPLNWLPGIFLLGFAALLISMGEKEAAIGILLTALGVVVGVALIGLLGSILLAAGFIIEDIGKKKVAIAGLLILILFIL